MKVIAAINGTIASEGMAFYALKYAQVQNFSLVLLHIENPHDDLDDVEASANRIITLANSKNIEIEYVLLQGSPKKAIQTFFSTTPIYVDIIFCTTRKRKKLITGSFSEALTKMDIDADIAIVRIVKMSHIHDFDSMMLCIKEDKLSVKKFTFFATMATAYKASGEIYSVSNIYRWEFPTVDLEKVKEKLSTINFNLRHYIKLAYMMVFTLHIKHDFTKDESRCILTHIVKSNTKLVIVGAKRLSIKSFFKQEVPIDRLMRESSVNIIAFYPKED